MGYYFVADSWEGHGKYVMQESPIETREGEIANVLIATIHYKQQADINIS